MENKELTQTENNMIFSEKHEREWHKLSCLRLAKGDLTKAESYYKWVTSS